MNGAATPAIRRCPICSRADRGCLTDSRGHVVCHSGATDNPPPGFQLLRLALSGAGVYRIEAPAVPTESARSASPVVVRLSDVQPEVVRWLWPGRLPLGKLSLLIGDPSTGKSVLGLDLAARVSSGTSWPDLPDESCEAGAVVLLSAEDDLGDTIRPRLDAAGADVSRVLALQAVRRHDPESGQTCSVPFTLADDLSALETAITATPGCRLVIIDPISAFMGGGPRFDSHRNTDVRAVLAPLAELAARRGVAVVGVTHLRKGEGPAIYRAMGSLAFIATARAAWAVARDNGDPTGRRRLMLPVKCNLAVEPTGLAFELRDCSGVPVVAWQREPITMTADDALAAVRPGRPGPAPDRRDDAADWLRVALASGPRLSRDVFDEGVHGEGFSRKTIERARAGLGVDAYRKTIPGPWFWRLNGQERQDTSAADPGDLDVVAKLGQKQGFLGSLEAPTCNNAKLVGPGDLAWCGQ